MKKITLKASSVGGSVAILSISRLIAYGVSLIGTMQLARFRTLSEYGTYSQMLLAINLFTTLITLGLPNCLNYFLARAETKKERKTFLSVYYSLNTLLSFIVGFSLWLAIPLIENYFKNPDIGNFSYFLLLFPWTKIIKESVENLLVAYKRTDYLAAYRITHSISVVAIISFVKLMGWSFSTYVRLSLLSELCFTVIVYLIVTKLDGRFLFKFDWSLLKSIIVFSVPLGLSIASGTLKAEMDKMIIGFFYTTEEYAIYANAAKELPLTFISASITAVLLPEITKMVKNNAYKSSVKLWHEATIISYLINAYFAFALFFFSEEAISFLYSEKYSSGALVFGLYSLVLLFRSTYFGMFLQALGKTKIILQNSIITMLLNLVLNIIFCKTIGFTGPAFATIIATAWGAGFQLFKTAKLMKMSIKEIFPWKTLLKISIANLSIGFIFLTVQKYLPLDRVTNNEWEAIILAICWLLFYIFVFRKLIKQKVQLLRSY